MWMWVCVCVCLLGKVLFTCCYYWQPGSLFFVSTFDSFLCTHCAALGAAKPPKILINYSKLAVLFSWLHDSSVTSTNHIVRFFVLFFCLFCLFLFTYTYILFKPIIMYKFTSVPLVCWTRNFEFKSPLTEPADICCIGWTLSDIQKFRFDHPPQYCVYIAEKQRKQQSGTSSLQHFKNRSSQCIFAAF